MKDDHHKAKEKDGKSEEHCQNLSGEGWEDCQNFSGEGQEDCQNFSGGGPGTLSEPFLGRARNIVRTCLEVTRKHCQNLSGRTPQHCQRSAWCGIHGLKTHTIRRV